MFNFNIKNKKNTEKKKRKEKCSCCTKVAKSVIFLLIFLGIIRYFCEKIRLDQYSITILSTTAGIVGTMFGLTAASYAFIWGDLRSDRKENKHLEVVLQQYSNQLWAYFMTILISTIGVILISLIGMALAQHMMDSTLFETVGLQSSLISAYKNENFRCISVITCFNLGVSLFDIIMMARMNYKIFARNAQYADIAKNIMRDIDDRYGLSQDNKKQKGDSAGQKDDDDKINQEENTVNQKDDSDEYEKIHNLEILVNRILKNHESIGEAFTESQRRKKLLTEVIRNDLLEQYGSEIKKEEKVATDSNSEGQLDFYKNKMKWSYLPKDKMDSRFDKCLNKAKEEWKFFEKQEECVKKEPVYRCFINVYEDLMSYRDNSLIYEENSSGRKAAEIVLSKSVSLRHSIKRRLLCFYLIGENFTEMDCTNMSFSGADLRYTNFSRSNLSHVRLKGANCENADFTAARMTGMYFSDIPSAFPKNGGEIQVTYEDKGNEWEPYCGRDATCLKNATFKEADVSRIYLKAPGEVSDSCVFPFCDDSEQVFSQFDSKYSPFSLEGTNFDYAKMFYAYLKNVSLEKASLEKAQLYNAGFVMVKAESANFSGATMTNACLAWCDFQNADFSGALMSETILLRVDFKGAKLSNANFSYSNIIACNFYGASCQNVSFKNMIQNRDTLKGKEKPDALSDINLGKRDNSNSRFEYSILTNTDFSGAILDEILFANCVGQNCLFSEAKGRQMLFSNSLFRSSVFNRTCFEECSFENTIFSNSVFINTHFSNSTLCDIDFSDTAFTVAKEVCFTGGRISDSNFTNVKGLTEKCFDSITLERVDFSGIGLKKKKFAPNVILKDCVGVEN